MTEGRGRRKGRNGKENKGGRERTNGGIRGKRIEGRIKIGKKKEDKI